MGVDKHVEFGGTGVIMELQEFVTEALVAITEGLEQAMHRALDKPWAYNPVWAGEKVDWKDRIERVEFDVAVTEETKTSAGGKGGIKIFSAFEAGGEGSKAWESSTVSRIKFSIPVVFPAQRKDRT
jgi:hypothetical protein